MNPRAHRRYGHLVLPAVIALWTLAVFLPATGNGFVTWDDDKNFLENHNYRGLGLQQLRWMWTTFHLGHYVPLSWMTLGADYTAWGMNAAGYHLTNILLHALNAVLVYHVIQRLLVLAGKAPREAPGDATRTRIASAIGALFFAIHPLRVESVVWVTERRDVLSLAFMLSSVLAYLRWTAGKGALRRWYVISILLFAAALLSKATVMTLPAVLLLINLVPLRRVGVGARFVFVEWKRVALELAPFVVLAVATVGLSLVALRAPGQLGNVGKFAVSAYSLCFYVWKSLAPWHLSPIYEMPLALDPLAPRFVLSMVGVALYATVAFALRRSRPGVSVCMAAFVILVLPMLGIVQNGPQIAADRYTYFAAPALSVLLSAALVHRLGRPALLASAVVVCSLSALTVVQSRVWHDSETFWRYVLLRNPASSSAHAALGHLRLQQGRAAEAIEEYGIAVRIDPKYADGHNNMGVALVRLGRFDEAMSQYRRALDLRPIYAEAQSNMGALLARRGDLHGAIRRYRLALLADSINAEARVNWGNALVQLGQPAEALPQYAEAMRIDPRNADAAMNWGVALARLGDLRGAIGRFQQSLALSPDNGQARQFLGAALELERAR